MVKRAARTERIVRRRFFRGDRDASHAKELSDKERGVVAIGVLGDAIGGSEASQGRDDPRVVNGSPLTGGSA